MLADRGLRMAFDAVDRLSGKLEDFTSRGGVAAGAASGGLKAVMAGKDPKWGAVRGAVAGLSTRTKVLVVLSLVLALLLGPIALVLLLLALLVVAIAMAVRSAGRHPG